jgi:hypothetical protein
VPASDRHVGQVRGAGPGGTTRLGAPVAVVKAAFYDRKDNRLQSAGQPKAHLSPVSYSQTSGGVAAHQTGTPTPVQCWRIGNTKAILAPCPREHTPWQCPWCLLARIAGGVPSAPRQSAAAARRKASRGQARSGQAAQVTVG